MKFGNGNGGGQVVRGTATRLAGVSLETERPLHHIATLFRDAIKSN